MLIVLGLINLFLSLQTLNSSRFGDLEIILILLVISEDQMFVLIFIRHVSKHLEDLLQGCLRSWVLANRKFFFFSFDEAKQVTNGFVVAKHSELKWAIVIAEDFYCAEVNCKLFDYFLTVLNYVNPFNKMKDTNKALSITLSFTKKFITESSSLYLIQKPLWEIFLCQ